MSFLELLTGQRREEPSSAPRDDCPLCANVPGTLIWRGAYWRLFSVDDPNYPGYMRLVLNRHCTELTQLAKPEQKHLFALLVAIESEIRDLMLPEKVNIASLGNQTPHQHWHIIPRYQDDAHFPDSIWSPVRNTTASPDLAKRAENAKKLFEILPPLCKKAVY